MNDSAASISSSTARHLLHNLRNAKALRENPLVWHLFKSDVLHPGAEVISDRVVVSRVAAAVAAVLRTLSPADGNPFGGERTHRQAEIVRRCLMSNEPYKAVARDLGISLRTLFRDLDGVRLRLVEELPLYSPPAASSTEAADTFELELRHANLLRNIGRFDEALVLLDRLAAGAPTNIQRARAWNSSAVALVDAGATDRATRTLERARVTFAGAEPSALKTLVACDVDLTDAMIARVKGDSASAAIRYDRAAELSAPLLTEMPNEATNVHVRALSQGAMLEWLTGDMAAASVSVERAWTALERLADPPDSAHYSLLAASAVVHLVADGDVAWAIREMSAAAVLAERHGMLHDALMALCWLAGLERVHGNLAGAVATGRRTIAIARNTMTGTEFGLLCAATSENETASGNVEGALALIHEGRARVEPGGSAWSRLHLSEADALLAAGRNAEALVASSAALDAMQHQGKAGFVGTACLLKAVAHDRLGERAQALLATREAIPLLERFGKSPELVAAYELSAKLTGNRRHLTTANELRQLLKS